MVLGLRDYSFRQVEVWALFGSHPRRFHERIADGRARLVAADDWDCPTTFADLTQDGHLDFLYCSPDVAGRGVGSIVYDELEKTARKRGIARLTSQTSEGAQRFFRKKGFMVTEKRELRISGIRIHTCAMEKTLANGEGT